MESYAFTPIGVVRSPLVERAAAPRQPGRASGAYATIELLPGHGYEDALEGLALWSHAWVLFVFHRNVEQGRGWRPKVLPPRSTQKIGVFATRSPHRPNPIGMSAVRIDRVEGLVVHVRDADLLDGTPVLDIKPYVAYADAHADAAAGWLEVADPIAPWEVAFAPTADAQLAWLEERGVVLRDLVRTALALGPQPHAYRRIRSHGRAKRLGLKDWRIDFEEVPADASGPRRLLVHAVWSGYRAPALAVNPDLSLHAAFAAKWGYVRPPTLP
jgi:tRNA-Thr(GGU) m(6)t(6)A37 methyltransferase TsaA